MRRRGTLSCACAAVENPDDLSAVVDTVIESELQAAVIQPLRDHIYALITTTLRRCVCM